MSKKKPAEEAQRMAVEQAKKPKVHYTKSSIVLGLVAVVVGVVDYFGFFPVPQLFLDILLVIAGLWLMFQSLGHNADKWKREKLKRYI